MTINNHRGTSGIASSFREEANSASI